MDVLAEAMHDCDVYFVKLFEHISMALRRYAIAFGSEVRLQFNTNFDIMTCHYIILFSLKGRCQRTLDSSLIDTCSVVNNNSAASLFLKYSRQFD